MMIFLVAVFDSRHKLRYVNVTVKDMYNAEKAELILKTLNEEYSGIISRPSPIYDGKGDQGCTSSSSNTVVDEEVQDTRGLKKSQLRFMRLLNEDEDVNQNELEKYLKEGLEKVKSDLDILLWWKENSNRFPIVSLMARDILAIPISTVASKSAFSTSRQILDPFRSSLSPRVVEGLVCAQDWFKGVDIFTLPQEEADMIDNGKTLLVSVLYIQIIFCLAVDAIFCLSFRCRSY